MEKVCGGAPRTTPRVPAIVELSVPPLRKQPTFAPDASRATASRSKRLNSAASSGIGVFVDSLNTGVQLRTIPAFPLLTERLCPARSRSTPLKILRDAEI